MNINVTTAKVNIDNESLNKGEYNVRECNFDLDEEYEGLVCKALFTVTKTKLTYEQSIVNGKCNIPYEATVNRGKVIVGVVGYEVNGEELVKRYSPEPDEFFVLDGSYVEDIENQSTPTPTEIEQLEQRVSQVEIDAAQVEINTQDISNIKQEQTTQNNDILLRSLITETGSQIELSLNSTNFKMTATLKDKNGTVVNTSNEIDLPLESVVVNASYDSATKEIVLTLQNGNTVRFSVADLVSGLVSDTDYATASKGGVIKTNAGFEISGSTGLVRASDYTYEQYNNIGRVNFISKGTLENVITGKQLINKTQLDESQATQDTAIQTLQTDLANKADKSSLVTGSGTEVTLNNTAELEFIQPPLPRGNSEQVQYSGKNKLNATQESWTLAANTTVYQAIVTAANKPYLEAGTKYYFSYNVDNASSSNTRSTLRLYLNQEYIQNQTANANLTAGRKVWEFTPTVSGNYEVQYWLQGSNVAVTVSDFMISTSSDTTYEPYVGGTASPNPSYPQEITNVTGNVEVLVQNKNLAWNGWAEDFVNRINDNTKAKLETKDNRSCLFYLASAGYNEYDNKYLFKPKGGYKENTQYTFSFDLYSTTITGNLTIEYTDGTRTGINTTANTWKNITVTSASGKTIKYLRPSWFSGSDYIDLNTFMVEENTTASTYTPHKEQTLPLTLGNIELCKIGDYQDYFYKENNKWYLYKAIGKVVLDGSSDENWYGYRGQAAQYTYRTFAVNGLITADIHADIISDHFIKNMSAVLDANNNGIYIYSNNVLYIAIDKSLIADTEPSSFKTWLSSNNVIAYYQSSTPTITEIPDTTLISQLEAIKQALSYEEQTNISGSSDESNPLFEVQAVEYKEPDYWTIAYVNTQIGNAIGGAY